MPDVSTSDALAATLKYAERNESHHRFAVLSAAVLEAVFLAMFLLLTDFSNRTHILLLMAFAGGFSLFALAAVALGTYANRHTLRVLRAVELLRGELVARRVPER